MILNNFTSKVVTCRVQIQVSSFHIVNLDMMQQICSIMFITFSHPILMTNNLDPNQKKNSKSFTLLYRIQVPGRLFFFGTFFQPGCLIRYSPLIKIKKCCPGRMPNRYSLFIFFKDFQLYPINLFIFTKTNTSVLSRCFLRT